MTSKEIESKIAKYLRKANRLRPLRAKLARVNELMDILRGAFSAAASGNEARSAALENYLDLCRLHKLKFQLDSLLVAAATEIQRSRQQPEAINPKSFERLRQRLQTIVDIDPTYPEAPEWLKLLQAEYSQFVTPRDDVGASLNLAQYQAAPLCIEIACNVQDLEGHARLQAIYQQYHIPPRLPENQADSSSAAQCRMRFASDQLKDCEILHEELHVKSSYRITVNQRAVAEQFFSDWFQCYRRFLKAANPQYCYGASPFTFNFFGCHKLYVPDVAKQLEQCWFQHGEFDSVTGVFFVAAPPVVEQMRAHLPHCGFCPALTQAKLALGLALLPQSINPECDRRWRYDVTPHGRVGVLPAGNDIAIAAPHPTGAAAPPELIEVGPTPCLQKILRYLASAQPSALSEPAYKGLGVCPHCGAPYKRHTMTCSRCRLDFWKYALKDLENTLKRLRCPKELALPAWPAETQEVSLPSAPGDGTEATPSFEQLWHDPEVQQLLAQEPQPVEADEAQPDLARATPPVQTVAETPVHPQPLVAWPAADTRPSAERPALPEKLRRFVSRKYRERKALEKAFAQPAAFMAPELPPSQHFHRKPEGALQPESMADMTPEQTGSGLSNDPADSPGRTALINAVKNLKPRQKSELSKRGVVRVIYHATMDKDTCPLCRYLDGMVMDPDDPATDIFSPPLYPSCTCRREYVLKTEKPQHWPKVTFTFPPDELLIYLDK